MFLSTMSSSELNLGFPDICLTPPLPVPIPYLNYVTSSLTIPSTANLRHLACGAPVCLSTMAGSVTCLTQGDEGGVLGGVASGTFMGVRFNILGSSKVFSAGRPVHKMLGITLHNTCNIIGATLTPAQPKVLVLS